MLANLKSKRTPRLAIFEEQLQIRTLLKLCNHASGPTRGHETMPVCREGQILVIKKNNAVLFLPFFLLASGVNPLYSVLISH